MMYDVSEPKCQCAPAVTLSDEVLRSAGLCLTDVNIIDEYSKLSLTFSQRKNTGVDASISSAMDALQRIGFPAEAQRVRSFNASANSTDCSIEVQNFVLGGCKEEDLNPLPQGVVFKTIARQISVPHDYLMMWARLYLYPDGGVPDDAEEILFRTGSELLKHLPWWDRWRPAFLGEDAIWSAANGTVYFDYRLGDHCYAISLADADVLKIIQPDEKLLPILRG